MRIIHGLNTNSEDNRKIHKEIINFFEYNKIFTKIHKKL